MAVRISTPRFTSGPYRNRGAGGRSSRHAARTPFAHRRPKPMNPAILTAETTLTDLAQLRSRIAGDVIAPGDAEYDVARQAWNLAVDQTPVMVAMPESAGDVARIVRYAREKGL